MNSWTSSKCLFESCLWLCKTIKADRKQRGTIYLCVCVDMLASLVSRSEEESERLCVKLEYSHRKLETTTRGSGCTTVAKMIIKIILLSISTPIIHEFMSFCWFIATKTFSLHCQHKISPPYSPKCNVSCRKKKINNLKNKMKSTTLCSRFYICWYFW